MWEDSADEAQAGTPGRAWKNFEDKKITVSATQFIALRILPPQYRTPLTSH